MSTDGYDSPTGIPTDRQAERRLNDLGVTLDRNADGDILATFEDPTEGIAIVACIDDDASVGAIYEAFAAVNQQAILEAGFRQEVDR